MASALSFSNLFVTIYNIVQTLIGAALSAIGVYLLVVDDTPFSKGFLAVGIIYTAVGVYGGFARYLNKSCTTILWFICCLGVAAFQLALFVTFAFFEDKSINYINRVDGAETSNVSTGVSFVEDNATLLKVILAAGAAFEIVGSVCVFGIMLHTYRMGHTTANGPLYA